MQHFNEFSALRKFILKMLQIMYSKVAFIISVILHCCVGVQDIQIFQRKGKQDAVIFNKIKSKLLMTYNIENIFLIVRAGSVKVL